MNSEQKISINKMGTEPIRKIMLTMGIPMILSMVLQACYNIVDSMFVARMADTPEITHAGELAVNALTLAFPIQMLIVAFSIGTGVGVNALVSMNLGRGNREAVAKAAGNGITLVLILYFVFLLFGLMGIDSYLHSQTTNPIILQMAKRYLQICVFLSFGIFEFGIFEKLLQATGKTTFSMISQIAGALVNIALDPILIYGWFGLPALRIDGAAWATVIGQIVSLGLNMFFHYRYNHEIPNGFRYLKLHLDTIKRIYSIGLPAIIMQALMSFMTYGVNIILGAVSTAAVTSYGIFYKIQQFIFFAGFGLRDAITPIVSYNRGMENQTRVKEGMKYGILYIEIIMLAGVLGLEIFATPLISLFGLTDETAQLCILATRIIAGGFLFAGLNIAIQGIYQAIDCGIQSLLVSLLRLLVIVLPLCRLFTSLPAATTLVWFAFPISECIAAIVAVILLARAVKMQKK